MTKNAKTHDTKHVSNMFHHIIWLLSSFINAVLNTKYQRLNRLDYSIPLALINYEAMTELVMMMMTTIQRKINNADNTMVVKTMLTITYNNSDCESQHETIKQWINKWNEMRWTKMKQGETKSNEMILHDQNGPTWRSPRIHLHSAVIDHGFHLEANKNWTKQLGKHGFVWSHNIIPQKPTQKNKASKGNSIWKGLVLNV